MTLARLIVRNTLRRPVRLALTVGGLAMVVLAFGLIRMTLDDWNGAARGAMKNRLIVVNAMSEEVRLPLAYRARLAAMPGVQTVHFGSWFGGQYQDPKNTFGSFAEPAATFFDTYHEILLGEQEQTDFQRDRRGAIIGIRLAERFGWKVGDTIPLKGTAYPGDWEVTVRGIFRTPPVSVMGNGELYIDWAYANERLRTVEPDRADQVGWYVVKAREGVDMKALAAAIDEGFANSAAETRTETEQAFITGWVARAGALMHAMEWMSWVINGIGLLVLVNVLVMSARERTKEYAVIKTLGFRPAHCFSLVFGESLLLALAGWVLGLALSAPVSQLYWRMTQPDNAPPPPPVMTVETIALCFGAMMVVALAAALWPARRLMRMTAQEGLRHVG